MARFAPPPLAGSYNLVRVLAAATTPFAPEVVTEISVVDMVIDDSGPGVGGIETCVFDQLGYLEGHDACDPCTPMHLATFVWSKATPDVLVAYDATTAGVIFGPGLTRGLPWICLYRLAKFLWPKAPDYSLEGLVCWRNRVEGVSQDTSFDLPSGTSRDVHLCAILLTLMLREPALRAAGHPEHEDDVLRQQRLTAILSDLCRADALQAAVRISANSVLPLRAPPCPWDDQREWASLGQDDLRWFVRAGPGDWVREHAAAELARRAELAAGENTAHQGLILRRTGPLKYQ